MIKFFRKIRQKLVSENKFSKYLIYAIGEIVLVVIGILIALAINNWNNEKQRKSELTDSFKSIFEEISIVSSIAERKIKRTDSIILKNQKSLRLIKAHDIDSVFQLEHTLRGLIALSSTKFELPVTMEFIADDNTKKLKNKKLKKLVLKLKSEISFLGFYQDYATTQYQSLIEPYVVKNLNSAKIQNRNTSIDVGREINYADLLNDLELPNILNFKLETDIGASERLKELNLTLKNLENEIQQEINKK